MCSRKPPKQDSRFNEISACFILAEDKAASNDRQRRYPSSLTWVQASGRMESFRPQHPRVKSKAGAKMYSKRNTFKPDESLRSLSLVNFQPSAIRNRSFRSALRVELWKRGLSNARSDHLWTRQRST